MGRAERHGDESVVFLQRHLCYKCARTLEQPAQRFGEVGTTALVLTKLDEVTGLGNLLPLLRNSRLPLSYLTNGQNVPDDIETAEARRMARLVLAVDSVFDT